MDEALAVMEQAVLDCLSANVYSLPSAELVSRLDRVHAFSQQVAALELGLVREVDARGLPAAEGAHSTGAWLAHKWRVSPGTTARLVKLAKLVDSSAPQSGVALGEGRVNVEQVHVIASAVRELPVGHQPEGERFLLEQAAVFAPRDLGRLGERLLYVVDPEGAEQKAADQLAKDEARGYRDRTLSVFDIAGTSKVRISGWLDREGGAIIRAALDPLCAPRRDRDDARFNSRAGAGAGADLDAAADAGAGTDSDAGAGTGSGVGAGTGLGTGLGADAGAGSEAGAGVSASAGAGGGQGAGVGAGFPRGPGAGGGLGASTGERDSRSPGQRRIDALVDICRLALATGELPDNGGDRPQLVVTVPFEVLRSQVRRSDPRRRRHPHREFGTTTGLRRSDPARRDGRGQPTAGPRTTPTTVHRTRTTGTRPTRQRLRLPTLRPASPLDRRAPHPALGRWRSHRTGQRGAAVRLPPPAHPPRRMDRPHQPW